MRAVILAGGQGTRMRPYTAVLPKPLLPVAGLPVLELILRRLAGAGFRKAELCVGHLGALIQAYLSEGAALPDGIDLAYHWEDEPLGTAGALRLIEPGEAPFLVMNGDIISDLDFAELMNSHVKREAKVTVATTEKAIETELGVIEHNHGWITGYNEKPTLSFRVSMGIYVCDPAALAHIPAGRFDFPDLVKALIASNERVALYPFEGKWFDIGTVNEYEQALAEIEARPELLQP